MSKHIFTAFTLLFLSSCAYADEAYYINAQSTVGPYSIEFMPGKCAGNFDINNHLFLRLDNIKRKYCVEDVCPVTIYQGVNCSKTNNIIATGSTTLGTGEFSLSNHFPHNYIITASKYVLTVQRYFQ